MAPDLALPEPSVVFDADFVRRLEALHFAVRGRAARRDGGTRAGGVGEGLEFVGYRPYRPGEDLRQLDWNLLGRLDRPFVRVTQRETSERWAVLIDTSASMGVGPPGKLQWAAEVAAAVASIALENGASVHAHASDGQGSDGGTLLRRRADLHAWMRTVEAWRAGGAEGLGALLDPVRLRGVDRVVAIGDWVGVEPAQLGASFARGRTFGLVQVLAPDEVAPSGGRGVEWWGAEGEGRGSYHLDAETLDAYERELELELERWSEFAARHRLGYVFRTSTAPFEEAVLALLGN